MVYPKPTDTVVVPSWGQIRRTIVYELCPRLPELRESEQPRQQPPRRVSG